MRNKQLIWVTQTALLIALITLFQLIPVSNQFITGSLVNLVLIVGAGFTGFASAGTAAALSPILAALFGKVPLPQMIPVIIIGNLIIVGVTYLFFTKSLKEQGKSVLYDITGVILGAALKCAFLWIATLLVVVPLFSKSLKVSKMLSAAFTWPQLITALIGGFLALLVLPALRKAFTKK